MSHVGAFQTGTVRSIRQNRIVCKNCSCLQRHAAFRRLQSQSRLRHMHIRAEKEDGQEKGQKIEDRKVSERASKLVEGMKKGGIDQSTAQRILDTWEKTGATSTDALRKMLLGRSLKTVGVVLFQLVLDGGAALGAYNSARCVINNHTQANFVCFNALLLHSYKAASACPVSATRTCLYSALLQPSHTLSLNKLCRYVGREEFFGKIVIEYGAYFLASYFAIGVIFDTFTLGVLAASAFQYSTNTEAFMAAVKEVAGSNKRGPNINVVEKAQTAVNAIKVASALNQISSLLKVRFKTLCTNVMLCTEMCTVHKND